MIARTRWLLALVLLSGLAVDALAQQPVMPRPKRKGRKYTYKIDSSPQMAAIYLDDKQYGIWAYTPWSGKLNKGRYKIIIELQGYKTAERIVDVDYRNRQVFIPLERQVMPGTIDVQAVADQNVLGAQVVVDGQPQGTAPLATEVPAGRHLLELKKTNFQEYAQWVNIKEGERVTLTPVLKPLVVSNPKGSLLVDADVEGAEVFVDGKRQADSTPMIIDDLDEGPHVVEVRKAPAVPWKQTVYVKAGQRTKVRGELASTLQNATQPQGGNVRVISNVEGAEVMLDGVVKGKAPIDLSNIPPGQHIIEVRAKGHAPREETVAVNAGSSTILKMDLSAVSTARPTTGKINVRSTAEEPQVFIDGANVGTAPVVDKEVSAGEHFIVVQKAGYARFEQKVVVEAGQTVTISAELRAIGALRFLSNVQGAEVVLDGMPVGKTPFVKEDIDVGEHVVTIRMEGYYDYEQAVKVEGGKLAIINADMRQIDTGPTPEDIIRMRRGLTSFGARTMGLGRFSLDAGIGYPYWVQVRSTVGVIDSPKFGWDVGVGFRSYLTTWEFLATARFKLFQREPFAFAAFGTVGGGGGFDGRNMFTFQAGGVLSITFRNLVTVSGRAYLDVWSDRLCGVPEPGADLPTSGPKVCYDSPYGTDTQQRLDELFGAGEVTTAADLQDRDSGARLFLSLIVEAAIQERLSVFFIFEGPPFQGERAAHTDLFNSPLLEKDPLYSGTLGLTAKF